MPLAGLNSEVTIRAAEPGGHNAIWSILEPTIRGGETYTWPRDLSREQALDYWFAEGHEVFVAELEGAVAGTYCLRANQQGGGAHVANCGYMTASRASGRAVARAMCAHSLETARELGFRAMQFNFVVGTNQRPEHICHRSAFELLARFPTAL